MHLIAKEEMIPNRQWNKNIVHYFSFLSVPYFMLIHSVDVEIFLWISENFDMLGALDEVSQDHQSN